MKKNILIIAGIGLTILLVVFVINRPGQQTKKNELKLEVRDEAANPMPKTESLVEPGSSVVVVGAESLPVAGKIWQVGIKSPIEKINVEPVLKSFDTKGEIKNIVDTEVFMVEEDTKSGNKRVLLSKKVPNIIFAWQQKGSGLKNYSLDELGEQAAKIMASLAEKEGKWSAVSEQTLFLKNSGESSVVASQEDFDVVRYLASWKWEDNKVYSKGGYPIRLDFAKTGLIYAEIGFLPGEVILQKENLIIKNPAQLADGTTYQTLRMEGDNSFYTYDLEHKYKNILSKQNNFRTGYLLTDDNLLWPYVFVDGEIYDTASEGRARVLLGTSLIR